MFDKVDYPEKCIKKKDKNRSNKHHFIIQSISPKIHSESKSYKIVFKYLPTQKLSIFEYYIEKKVKTNV